MSQVGDDVGARTLVEVRVGPAELASGDDVRQRERLSVQPVRAPVGRDQAAVPPDRAQLHAADGPPDLLASLDVLFGEQHLAVGGDHLAGDGRSLLVDLLAVEQQRGERREHHHAEYDPQAFEREGVFVRHDGDLMAGWRGRAASRAAAVQARPDFSSASKWRLFFSPPP